MSPSFELPAVLSAAGKVGLGRRATNESSRFVRFLLVGAGNAGAGYLIFLLLLLVLEMNYLVANLLTFCVWVLPGFHLQRTLVFRAESAIPTLLRYIVTQSGGFGTGT